MRRVGPVAVLALLVAACAPTIPERVQEFNEAGVRLLRHGEFDHAREEFQAALMLQPNNPDLLFNLGQCADHLGQSGEAEQFYGECLKVDPNHAEGRHALTVLLVSSGRRLDAQRMVQDWLSRAPRLAAAYAEDGWLYERDGDSLKALKRYQQALDLDARNNRALIEMGMIYEERGNLERALQLYQTALDCKPDQPDLVRRINLLRAKGIGRPHPNS